MVASPARSEKSGTRRVQPSLLPRPTGRFDRATLPLKSLFQTRGRVVWCTQQQLRRPRRDDSCPPYSQRQEDGGGGPFVLADGGNRSTNRIPTEHFGGRGSPRCWKFPPQRGPQEEQRSTPRDVVGQRREATRSATQLRQEEEECSKRRNKRETTTSISSLSFEKECFVLQRTSTSLRATRNKQNTLKHHHA